MGSFGTWIAAFSLSGCDALVCALEALAFGSTIMCGRDTFWLWVISAIPFVGATWEHYFTNTLILPVINGPTEGLMLIYSAHFFTAIVEISTYKAVLLLMTAFGVIPTIMCNIRNAYKVVQARKGNMLLALAMLCPFVALSGGVLVWDCLSPSDILGDYPHLVVAGTGLAFGFLVGRMILAHLCDEPKGLKTNMSLSLLSLPFAIANALTARFNDGVPLVDESLVVRLYFTFSRMVVQSCLPKKVADVRVLHEAHVVDDGKGYMGWIGFV
ncbi:Choline/ethanolaminephosphotransferase 1 [Morella rubra]|uniref:Choline/ethanolaminephosphotransferase 1 n=1 Tax=Morella rubra TaxID=262757 RepID=A0A6A1V5K8_9ROSI|nr:Choline/ethanolaminephosphotransferase 1 [Morella rubra]